MNGRTDSLNPQERGELMEILQELEMTEWERYRRNIVEADKKCWADAAAGRAEYPRIAEVMNHCRELQFKVERGDRLTSVEREEWEARERRHKDFERMWADHCRIKGLWVNA